LVVISPDLEQMMVSLN